jgi:hypothetical protein
LETSVVAPEDGERQKFVIDPAVHVHTIYYYFWKRIAEELKTPDSKFRIYYRKK